MGVFFLFEECENLKERATYSPGKNRMCSVLNLLVGSYAYVAGDTKLLMSVIWTELKIQERNPVQEQTQHCCH